MQMQAQSTGLGARLSRYGDHFHSLTPVSPREAFFRYVIDRLALPGQGPEEAARIRQHNVRTAKGEIVKDNDTTSPSDNNITPLFYVFHGDMKHGKGAGPTRLVTEARYVLVSATVITAESLNGHLFTLGSNLEQYQLINGIFSEETRFERRKAVHIATLKLGENGEEIILWADIVISNAKPDNGSTPRNLSVVLSGNFILGRELLDEQERFSADKNRDNCGITKNVLGGTSDIGNGLKDAILQKVTGLQVISRVLLGSIDNVRQDFFLIVDNV